MRGRRRGRDGTGEEEKKGEMTMQEKRIVVWVQRFKDRDSLMLQWIDPDTGKRKSQSAKTNYLPLAETRAKDLEYELNNNLHKEASRMSWEKFRQLFEDEYLSGRRANTIDNYADTFDAFERLCSPTSLRGITARTLSAFAGALRKQPGWWGGTIQESTVKVRIQYMRTALNWATKQKFIPECPECPVIRPPKRKPQPVSTEVVERLLSKAPDENMRVFLLTGWLAGLRLNEALGLEWDETDKVAYLDLDRDRIVFPAGFVKGGEDQWVPLDTELREAILSLPRHGRKVFRFVEARNGKPVKDIAVSHRVVEVARLAGVKMTMKSLRRGFGCYWASRVPAQVLQKLMRHSNIRITMDYYANVDDAAMQAVLNRQRNSLRNSEAGETKEAASEEAAKEGSNGTCD
jgi:integrase